nr:polyadenylate-binding protein 7-like isoform X2 [Nicotiana tomentosiformis]
MDRSSKKTWKQIPLCIIWTVLLERNKRCFEGKKESFYAARFVDMTKSSTEGFMFGQKPLYVAIAQRKEARQAQLQHMHAQGIAGATEFSAFFPGGYPPLYYRAPGVLQVPARPELMYQPLSMRHSGMVNGFTNLSRPACQPFPISLVSVLQIVVETASCRNAGQDCVQ